VENVVKRVIGNLRLGGKFLVIGLLCLVMCAIPFTLVVLDRVDDHRVARNEQRGMAPARDLLGLVRLTQQHRGLTATMLSGNAAAGEALKGKRAEVDAAVQVRRNRSRRSATRRSSSAPGGSLRTGRRSWLRSTAAL
jgi:hypothetical protein